MTFEGGITAVSYCAMNTYSWSGYTLVGKKGRIEGNLNFNGSGELKIEIIKDDKSETISVVSENNYKLEVSQLGRCILEGEKPLVTYEDSLRNAIVTDVVLNQMDELGSIQYK